MRYLFSSAGYQIQSIHGLERAHARLQIKTPRLKESGSWHSLLPASLSLTTMAPVAVESAPVIPANPPKSKNVSSTHPLDPLSADEVRLFLHANSNYSNFVLPP